MPSWKKVIISGSDAALNSLDVTTDITVGSQIIHSGDTNTNLAFTDDKIAITAGGVEMITLTEGAADNVHINAGAVHMDFKVSTDNDNNALFIEGSTDRVGIGTGTPAQKLHVLGSARVTGDFELTGANPRIDFNFNSSDALRFYDSTNASERMRIDSSGNVGIGTNSPSEKLDVNGNASISGSLTVSQGGNFTMDGGGTLDTGGGSLNTTGGSIDTNGGNINLGIGALNGTIPGSAVNVDTVTATVKNFVIDHPSEEKAGYKLRHSSLEGPEIGVYFRGKSTENIIDLPDYWKDLVDEDSITVNLTPFGSPCQHYIEDIRDNQVIVGCACGTPNYHFTVYGERKDVEKLVVEYKEEKYL